MKELKDKVKRSEGSGIETDQAEHLDALLNQSVNVLNKNHDTEETDASTTSKQGSRSQSPPDSEDTQMEIIMVEKRDTNLISSKQQSEMINVSKSTVAPKGDSH